MKKKKTEKEDKWIRVTHDPDNYETKHLGWKAVILYALFLLAWWLVYNFI